jgi:hypothetical protein
MKIQITLLALAGKWGNPLGGDQAPSRQYPSRCSRQAAAKVLKPVNIFRLGKCKCMCFVGSLVRFMALIFIGYLI